MERICFYCENVFVYATPDDNCPFCGSFHIEPPPEESEWDNNTHNEGTFLESPVDSAYPDDYEDEY